MLINPTWVHQISSNLVDLNVSPWMIFPQSFSHLSQFAYNFMVFQKCAPNGILGVEGTLAYVAQNCQ
jgi:hypothetical protein